MKVEIRNEPAAKLKLVKGTAYQIETAPHLPKLPMSCLFNGVRGAGKSVACVNLLRMFKETGTCQVVILVSPTWGSNRELMKVLDIKEEHIFEDPDTDPEGVLQSIDAIGNAERDEFEEYMRKKKKYDLMMQKIHDGEALMDEEYDRFITLHFDYASNTFRPPEAKHECWKEGKPASLFLVLDDCLSTRLFSSRKLVNLFARHRHKFPLSDGSGALGLSIMTLIQSFKSQSGGLPPAIRKNCTHMCIFKCRDDKELKSVAESFAGEFDTEKFIKLHKYATEEQHSFLFIDTSPKPNHSHFRKQFDKHLFIK